MNDMNMPKMALEDAAAAEAIAILIEPDFSALVLATMVNDPDGCGNEGCRDFHPKAVSHVIMNPAAAQTVVDQLQAAINFVHSRSN